MAAPGTALRIAEGKSRIEAMRCLKRDLARHYHQLLTAPPPAGIRSGTPEVETG
jgi:hypothetical protein